MIKNDKQRAITLRKISEFERALSEAAVRRHSAQPSKVKGDMYVAGLRSTIESMREELAEYDRLKSGDLSVIRISKVADVLPALVKYRIARGFTQKQLADLIGTTQQQVQRWEHFDYQTAAAHVLVLVAEALGVELMAKDADSTRRPISVVFGTMSAHPVTHGTIESGTGTGFSVAPVRGDVLVANTPHTSAVEYFAVSTTGPFEIAGAGTILAHQVCGWVQ